MAGGSRKHGAHRHVLSFPLAAAGSAADLVGAEFSYDNYAEVGAGTIAGPTIGYDAYAEAVVEASVVAVGATLTGTATNFVSPRLTQFDSAGNVKNRIRVAFSGTGVIATQYIPMNYGVASGATVPGAGTGTLTVDTGVALPWTLSPGDQIVFDRVSNNATGLATPAMSCNITIAGKGA